MQFRHVLVPIAALLLAGCGSSTSVSNANFAKAINVPLSKVCIRLTPGFLGQIGTKYPLSVPLKPYQANVAMSAEDAKNTNAQIFRALDALVKAGLITSTDAQVKAELSNKQVPGKIYSLTDAGKKALQRPDWLAFCAAHYKVVKVVNFTVPGKEMDGTTGSTVNFTAAPTNVPAWATSEAIKAEFPDFSKRLAAAMAQPQKGRADLVLMNDGWHASIPSLFFDGRLE